MTTRTVNIRFEKCDVKGCRLKDNTIPPPPAEGCMGNPFFLRNVHDPVERLDVVRKHRAYLKERLATDPAFKAYVDQQKGKRIGCFCAPFPCHVDNIVDYLEGHLYEQYR